MKQLSIVLLFFLAVACSNSETTKTDEKTTESTIVTDFIDNISSLEAIEKGNPIVLFQKQANDKANKIIKFSKDNIQDLLETAKAYKSLIITTGDHTIVKITDLNDCKQSGSWSACMPMAKGYIKKKALVYQEDYINNIIGIPDNQERVAYLFE